MTAIVLKNIRIARGAELNPAEIRIANGIITQIADKVDRRDADVYDGKGALALPGAVDVHVHLREPGFAHKETIRTGTKSAAKGGITSLMAMPNLSPTPDSLENLAVQEKLILQDAKVRVYPYASVTVGEKGKVLSNIEALAPKVRGFSDDGVGVNDLALLEEAMRRVQAVGGIIASHAEAEGYGTTREAEIIAVERELKLAEKTGCRYHFCHLSTAESFALVKEAQAAGVHVTCEVTPHHLFLCEDDIGEDTNFKMNPPLRTRADMYATQDALLSGVATIVATDHAPHAAEEKALPYAEAPNGIIGLETMLPLLYTKFVRAGRAQVEELINWVTVNPAKRFGIPYAAIEVGETADITLLDRKNPHIYTAGEILSKGKNSPFIGEELYGFSVMTLVGGNIVYNQIAEA